MDFQIHPLSADKFRHLFALGNEELAQRHACIMRVTDKLGCFAPSVTRAK